jgi:hypothetical protein
MGTSNQSNKQTLAQDVVQTGSPMFKKGRKVLSIDKLPFSPRVKPPQINKVFVVGAPLGVILIRTERQMVKMMLSPTMHKRSWRMKKLVLQND